MTHQPHTGPRPVIQAALEDWWITTDLATPFDPPTVAAQVETYLTTSGYTITHRRHVLTRLSITATSLLTLLCLTGAIACTLRGDWPWALIALAAAIAYAYDLHSDITEHRHRTARPESRQR